MLPAVGLVSLGYIYLGAAGLAFSVTTFPWGVLCSGLGCVCAFIAGIVLAIGLCRWDYHFGDDGNYEVGYASDGTPMTQVGQKQGYDNQAYPGSGRQPEQQYAPSNQGYDQRNMYRPVAAQRNN